MGRLLVITNKALLLFKKMPPNQYLMKRKVRLDRLKAISRNILSYEFLVHVKGFCPGMRLWAEHQEDILAPLKEYFHS